LQDESRKQLAELKAASIMGQNSVKWPIGE